MGRTWSRPDLPRYSWDQAHILRLATARGFSPLGVADATIRAWVAAGRIQPAGKAPGGAFLFQIQEVAAMVRSTEDGQ